MFTLFHILRLAGLIGGIYIGHAAGVNFGDISAIIGALLGACLGLIVGGLPERLVERSIARSLAQKSILELRTELHDETCLTVNMHLLALRHRGEDISTEIPLLLDLLCSESRERRIRAWVALLSAFPQLTKQIPTYSVNDPPAECKAKVHPLRRTAYDMVRHEP